MSIAGLQHDLSTAIVFSSCTDVCTVYTTSIGMYIRQVQQ